MKIANAILIDFHGVLTDGRQTISQDGAYMFDHVHVRDTRAIRELVARGYDVNILTASTSPIVLSYARKLKVDLIIARDKKEVLKRFDYDFIAIGDDAWDISVLQAAKRAFCPNDADSAVKAVEGIEVLTAKGGHGVIAELLPLLS